MGEERVGTEGGKSSTKMGFHGAGRNTERSGDLALIELTEIAQNHRLSLTARQTLEGGHQSETKIDVALRISRPWGNLDSQVRGFPTENIQCQVRSNPAHPRVAIVHLAEHMPSDQRRGECLGREILRHRPTPDQPLSQSKDPG